MVTPLKSDYNTNTLAEVQTSDGLYGVMLAAMRNLQEKYPTKDAESISLLAHRCLLNAMQEFLRDNNENV